MEINGHNKLVCIHNNKKKYDVHIKNLKQTLEHDLKLKKVHKAIAFYQEAWLKPYIELNTELNKKMQKTILKKTFTN